jgi:alkylation response protein AidB-like acyl-CoA dehydrogenase
MDLRFTPEEIAFRDEVRAFFRDNVPAHIHARLIDGEFIGPEDYRSWTRTLAAKGWGAPHWPVKYGGTGWDPIRQYIFLEEMQKWPAPAPLPFGVSMVGPVIYTFGSEAQKARYLPGILTLDDWWCQGFSEPGAGSDLASLRTKAVRDGDEYVVNGQKIWTTLAQYADWIFCLVRTNPEAKKQEGISFLLIDMKSPGREPRRRGKPRLGLCQVPARQRAVGHRARRPVEAATGANPRTGGAGILRRAPADRGCRLPPQARGGRGGTESAGTDADARRRGRCASWPFRQAGPGVLNPQDQGL